MPFLASMAAALSKTESGRALKFFDALPNTSVLPLMRYRIPTLGSSFEDTVRRGCR